MWYVLKGRSGQEETIIRSCRQHLSSDALDKAFSFRCERLWRRSGVWQLVEREMFPGYVFLESRNPDKLFEELEGYRRIFKIMEEPGYLISVYGEEEKALRELCGEHHCLKVSYGYRDQKQGTDCMTEGPLSREGWRRRIIRIDWHRRFAQVEILVAKKTSVVWAGIGLDERAVRQLSYSSDHPVIHTFQAGAPSGCVS